VATTKVVVLILTLWNADTGEMLHEIKQVQPLWTIWGVDHIEDCRRRGITRGKMLVSHFRHNGKPNAFANVNCFWAPRWPGQKL
jgi:hypothetical protein